MSQVWDVLVIGGGPAGLSAALSLGRLGLSALIVDDNRPRNAPSSHANNFPTRDGIHPAKWREAARTDLEKYASIEFKADTVISVAKKDVFVSALTSGIEVRSRRIVLAYGIQDQLPDIVGFRELWGKRIYHCPFCHGFEVRRKRLALYMTSAMALHPLPLIRGLSEDLLLIAAPDMEIPPEQLLWMKEKGVQVISRGLNSLKISEDESLELQLDDGTVLSRDALFAPPLLPFVMKSNVGEQLGCEFTEYGLYKVSERGETSVPGVYAAGDSTMMMQSVLNAAASGSMVGAMLCFDLLK